MSARTEPPKLDCPECGEPLIPANSLGLYDESFGDYVEHREGCGCPECDWFWSDDQRPVRCACGALVGVKVDDDHAYASTLEEAQP